LGKIITNNWAYRFTKQKDISVKKINKARYAILGMLANEPQSGYDLKQSIMGSVAYFWQESDASIYPMLKKLETEKKVTSHAEAIGKRSKTIFKITPTGLKELTEWLKIPAEDESSRNELLLKLFFSANSTKEDVAKQLELHQKRLAQTTQQFDHINEHLQQLPDSRSEKLFWLMTLNNGIMHAKTEARWITECFKILGVNKSKN
jgi:DNA-binding PadR family transcriptional regulator